MKFHLALSVCFAGTALATFAKRDSGCSSNNCARAVTGTQLGNSHPSIAKVDCKSFFQTTLTPIVTVHATDIVATTTVNVAKRQIPTPGIPFYARVCTDPGSYGSACSCLGVLPTTYTASPSTITITANVTAKTTIKGSSSSTSSSAPSCTANLLSDPANCGSCGNVCSFGICENGSCSSTACVAKTCGSFQTCNNGSNCFCFSSTRSEPDNGFCGANALCDGSTPCATDADCGSGATGNICAVNTCCPQPSNDKPGICLQGQCGNPAKKLMMMARAGLAGTAAYYT
ncbi:uncharacterized protein PAC_01820 [Phialocephala subalpina]|uniref:Uncharacterized protein n=1 Tax=Phialocephala subalpina TaxID=576137 RepID=A0A1L7WGS2_9HELO|nr:uncharacterized protein PAC_01820 [Phialocephala subalpina]